MPNGWSFNWEGMATREREGLETRCVESLLVIYLCLLSGSELSLTVARDNSLAHKG
jgi:hypothetical protein